MTKARGSGVDLDVIAFPQLERLDDRSRETHGQTVALSGNQQRGSRGSIDTAVVDSPTEPSECPESSNSGHSAP
jgi:hypothetical protein